ncbi:MAG: RHS repeat-associated core domain-containing protein, partial [Bacteroides sp.]|nr:RHS repeat-associated core domain-containing protein [Bacteroides sp.]
MKLKLLLATSLFCASIAYGQQSGQNYVLSRTMLNSAGTDYVDNVQYYDGLGRPMQSLSKAVQASTVKERLATLQEYDNMGRVGNSWLPTPVTANYTEAASLKNLATAASGYGDTHPYGKNVYEASPLERLTSQYGAGAAWHNNSKAVNTAYLLNQASGNLSCKRYYISNNTLAGGGSSDVYAAGRLHVTQTTDEDGKVSYTFTDLLGNTVLVRQVNGSELLDTYYVYDNYNNLRYVLQPMYQSEANLAKYAFQYEYDYRNRCVKKTLPGADYISYVYDDADLLIYSQDGNQRAVSTTASAQKWTYYKYDSMHRLTEQGECTGQSNTTNAVVDIKNYYDSYSFIGSTGFTNSNYTAGNSYGKGYLTGSEVTVLGSSSKIYKAFYYDQKGREVKRVQNNLLSGYDVTSTT